MLDFNRSHLSVQPLNQCLNDMIERAEPPGENTRQYLGASSIGSECHRKVQYDWLCDAQHPARIYDIFARGHFFEELSRQWLIGIGFKFAPSWQLDFKAVGGLFRGHADGILIDGPVVPGLGYPCSAASRTAAARHMPSCRRRSTALMGSRHGTRSHVSARRIHNVLGQMNMSLLPTWFAGPCAAGSRQRSRVIGYARSTLGVENAEKAPHVQWQFGKSASSFDTVYFTSPLGLLELDAPR